MNHINTKISYLIQRQKSNTKKYTTNLYDDLRSSNHSNQALHKTMSISMLATLIKNHYFDVRKVAQEIISTQKYNTLPQLVSREEIDRKVLNENEILLFLGLRDLPEKKFHKAIDANERAKEIKQGSDFLVNGILGPAIYAVQAVRNPKAKDNDEKAILHAYNQAVLYSQSNGKKGVVLRMTLKSDARTISYADFLTLIKINNAQIHAELKNYIEFSKYLNVFLNTPSLLAIAQGYDAIINIPDGSVIVLNRGALRIQKTNATSKNAMYAQIMIEVEEKIEKEKIKKIEQQKRENTLAQKRKLQQNQLNQNNEMSNSEKSYIEYITPQEIIGRMNNDNNLNEFEKAEIIAFAKQYQYMSPNEKFLITQTLKGLL